MCMLLVSNIPFWLCIFYVALYSSVCFFYNSRQVVKNKENTPSNLYVGEVKQERSYYNFCFTTSKVIFPTLVTSSNHAAYSQENTSSQNLCIYFTTIYHSSQGEITSENNNTFISNLESKFCQIKIRISNNLWLWQATRIKSKYLCGFL